MILLFHILHDMNFWERNEGEIFGGLVGVSIAIIAAFSTYLLSKYLAKIKSKSKYKGLLKIVYFELDGHENQFKLLKTTLDKIKANSLYERKFVIDNAPMQFDTSIIEKGLLQAIEYKNCDYDIMAILTAYLTNLRDTNYFLNFDIANQLLQNQTNKKEIEEKIANYFDTLNREYINKTQSAISILKNLITTAL